jgi:hypothetical protein
MDSNTARMDRRTLLRVTALLGVVPTSESTGTDLAAGAGASVAAGARSVDPRTPAGFAYDGTALFPATSDAPSEGTCDRQGYGEYGYGGAGP